jgi:hypothetical protein
MTSHTKVHSPVGRAKSSSPAAFTITKVKRLTALETKELLATGEFTVTPGGVRPKSMVHEVKPGQIVDLDGATLKRFDLATRKFIEPLGVNADVKAKAAVLPALGSGWITFGSYVENSSNIINFMTTTWTVPPAPTKSDGQVIFLFNGLQDSPVTHILQPVLQWGVSADGGGAKWSVASWFVDSSNNAFKTTLVDVNPGDTLTGVMRMTSNSAGKFNYTCEFSNIANTSLTVNNVNQLVMPVETLECYSITECRDYPNAISTSMRGISVNTSTGALITSFGGTNAITDCGQHTIVASNTAGSGEIDLFYTNQFSVPSPSPVTSANRVRDQIDLFAVGAEGGVYSTFWNDGGWLNRWFRLVDANFSDQFTVPPQSEVNVLSRFATHLDLFVVGRDSAVYSNFWDGNTGWNPHWFRLGDTNFADGFKVPVEAPISSLCRFTEHIDLFVSGFDGGVYSTFWDQSSGWFNHWFRLTDNNFGDKFSIPPGAPVNALCRFKDHLDLFVSGRDGAIYSTFWDQSSGWFNHWFRLADTNFGDHFTIPPGSPVTSLCRFKDHIDLFVSGRDGAIYSTFWDQSSGWFNHWFRLADTNFGDHFTIPPGAPVSALSRFKDHIDLFVVGRDGAIYSTFWDQSSGWFNHWFRLADTNFGDHFTVPAGSRISAMSRFQDHIDLFVVGRDGGIYSTFWDANGGWFNHWFRV